MDSIRTDVFSPLKTSSPKQNTSRQNTSKKEGSKTSTTSEDQNPYSVPKKQNLRIMTVNCRSIRDKSQELTVAIDYLKPDVVCGTESWLKGIQPGKNPTQDAIKSSEIFPPNYNIYRNDRGTLGGGVFIMVNKDIISEEQPDLITKCEIEWVKIKTRNNKDMLISSYYMPHRNKHDIQELEKSLELATNTNNKNIILAGDFNCPDIDWDNMATKPGNDRDIQQQLIDVTNTAGLTQIHEQPTRGENMLDLVFTSNASLMKSSSSVPGISDHDIVVTDLEIKPYYQKAPPRKCYIYAKANWDQLNKSLTNLSRNIVDMYNGGKSVHELWETFKTRLHHHMDESIPSKEIRSKHSNPWITYRERRLLRKKARLYKQAKKTNKWSNYRQHQKECKRKLRQAEWNYVNTNILEGLNNNNTKPFWKYIKSKKQDSFGIAPLRSGGKMISESKGKAEILVKQFQSVFTKDQPGPLPSVKKSTKNIINPIKIRTEGVQKLLSKVNPSKASGPDNIPNRILKECAEQLAPGLSVIFQRSIDSGELPKDWRDANISCIYKKSDKHLAENYRPVSLTSVTSKLLEHILCRHLLKHLEKNKILTTLNHGFRSGYSCETQLLTTMNDLLQSYDKGQQTDVAILDFSKAFDTVPHSKLLHKLEHYGIQGSILSWLQAFLTTRTMRTVVEGETSEEVHVESGVPQGTVLGPLLFLCHINDLPDAVKSQVRLFADDCLLYRTIKSFEDHLTLQKDLDNLQTWATDWGMRFNAKKCYIMSIRNKTHKFYSLDGHILEEVQDNPYLGLQISSDLKWTTHINKITKKAQSTLGFLRRNLLHCTENCRKTAYISMVRSLLEYSAVVWDPYQKSDIDKIERVQRKAIRFIKRDYRSREEGCISKMAKELELPTLQERRGSLRLVMLYKVVEGLVPGLPPQNFLSKSRPRRQIRLKSFENCETSNILNKQVKNNSKCFETIQATSNQYRNSFFVDTVVKWNQLDEDVVCAKTVEAFKTALDSLCQ